MEIPRDECRHHKQLAGLQSLPKPKSPVLQVTGQVLNFGKASGELRLIQNHRRLSDAFVLS